MINQLYEAIKQGTDIRKNLIELRTIIKDEKQNRVLYYEIVDELEVFYELLKHKMRK